ncbi:protein phosphatase 2C domain-containing protein [Nocardia farcinica]|nr:protein phosphatase 2C domain-containing protein [Nocardia farcinica]MBF6281998.1 protein phosphatase 2C domain-containing protein [Nocardia farcinica]MBF6306588.1 protein phosphatase 2C domain-containing protein [Nocardia farcinica]MBF6394097.1 protein phosphatase 2C domain-containing protein [Nocardia farcinica]MBF6490418.1 protein phosphatase 2C domain-containing protein [Nocardia farcinica]
MDIAESVLPDCTNEDRALVFDAGVIVLDGATSHGPDVPPASEYVDVLGAELTARMNQHKDPTSALAEAISSAAQALGLRPRASPSSTVAVVQLSERTVRVLVIGDTTVVIGRTDGTHDAPTAPTRYRPMTGSMSWRSRKPTSTAGDWLAEPATTSRTAGYSANSSEPSALAAIAKTATGSPKPTRTQLTTPASSTTRESACLRHHQRTRHPVDRGRDMFTSRPRRTPRSGPRLGGRQRPGRAPAAASETARRQDSGGPAPVESRCRNSLYRVKTHRRRYAPPPRYDAKRDSLNCGRRGASSASDGTQTTGAHLVHLAWSGIRSGDVAARGLTNSGRSLVHRGGAGHAVSRTRPSLPQFATNRPASSVEPGRGYPPHMRRCPDETKGGAYGRSRTVRGPDATPSDRQCGIDRAGGCCGCPVGRGDQRFDRRATP